MVAEERSVAGERSTSMAGERPAEAKLPAGASSRVAFPGEERAKTPRSGRTMPRWSSCSQYLPVTLVSECPLVGWQISKAV